MTSKLEELSDRIEILAKEIDKNSLPSNTDNMVKNFMKMQDLIQQMQDEMQANESEITPELISQMEVNSRIVIEGLGPKFTLDIKSHALNITPDLLKELDGQTIL